MEMEAEGRVRALLAGPIGKTDEIIREGRQIADEMGGNINTEADAMEFDMHLQMLENQRAIMSALGKAK